MKADGRLEAQERLRERISATCYMKRLHKQALDEIEMSDKSIKAATFLLNKVLPDLKAVEHSGEVDSSVFHIHLGK